MIFLAVINQGPIYHEECYCPESNVKKWYTSMDCAETSYTQLEKDLRKFENQSLDMNELGDEIVSKYYKPYTNSFCNYVILDNRVIFFPSLYCYQKIR